MAKHGAAAGKRDLVQGVQRRRRSKQRFLVFAFLLVAGVLGMGWWLAVPGLVLLLYIANEVLLADHIFYDPRCDEHYDISVQPLPHHWSGAALVLDDPATVGETLLLRIRVRARFLGRWRDPWVEFQSDDGERCVRQYFERGVRGYRYLNISALSAALAAGEPLRVKAGFCGLDTERSELLGFVNPPLAERRVLIVAPHADDAEIAAFGVYSDLDDCLIVTITAGETDAEQFSDWPTDRESAQQVSVFKGQVRALNGVSAALWGGLSQEQHVALGYPCMQLATMYANPNKAVVSPWSGLEDTRPFRSANRISLASDVDGRTSWDHLSADLQELVETFRPQVVICAHPLLDKHRDHVFATRAIWQAIAARAGLDPRWYLYVNHLEASQHYPFGPANSEIGLPPGIGADFPVDAIYSHGLDAQTQMRKALALDLMHDLRRPVKWKKWLRRRLQKLFAGRPLTPYGEDEFFRKAVRSSEVFFVAGQASMAQLMAQADAALVPPE